jgi:hypothetical protein
MSNDAKHVNAIGPSWSPFSLYPGRAVCDITLVLSDLAVSPRIDPNLQYLLDAWPRLPAERKRAILALVDLPWLKG